MILQGTQSLNPRLEAGVREIHFHALQHTFLTSIANGIGIDRPFDILQVKELVGHSDIQTTMLYVHSAGIRDTISLQWSRAERKTHSHKFIPFKTREARDCGL
jgi:integrase